MKNKRYISIFLISLIGLSMLLTGCERKVSANSITTYDVPQGIWMWDVTQMGHINTVENLSNLSIDVVYLNTGWSPEVNEFYLENHSLTYASFIREANNKNIEVQALLGNSNWAFTSNSDSLLKEINVIFDYNKTYKDVFTAIHLDIEPHTLRGWEDNKTEYVISYLENMKELKKVIDSHNLKNEDNLKLVLDIPHWYSGDEFIINGENVIELLSSDVADELVIMAYTKDKSNFVEFGKNVLNMVTDNEKIKIAIELKENETEITLYNMKSDELIAYVNDGIEEFNKYKAFHGLAIHDYKSYVSYINTKIDGTLD